jgi:hypothetical protein
MTLDSSTWVSPVVYKRVPRIRESVHQQLRNQIQQNYSDLLIDWANEKIQVIEFPPARRKCEDRCLIILSIEI